MTEAPAAAKQELAGANTLSLKLQKPHTEGYGEDAVFSLAPTEETLEVVDWRTDVDISEISDLFPRKSVQRRNTLVVNLDESEPTIETEEFATSENPFSRDYRLLNKMHISVGETDYATSYEHMTDALRTGDRQQIDRMQEGSHFQRHAIGIAQAGDLAGKMVFTDYRIVQPDIDDGANLYVDGLMLFGAEDRVKAFLEKVAKTKAPVTTHSPPAFDENGRATW